jgi:site-specific DNA-methyltransferase (adenine-specific)
MPLISAAETLGSSLKATRKLRKLSQKRLAEHAGLDLETVKSLEHGRGNVGSLSSAMRVLEIRISTQSSEMEIGPWLASKRKLAKLSQQQVATAIGLSKPTLIGLERGRGRISSFLLFMGCLGLSPTLRRENEPEPRAKLLHGECLELMTGLADGSVDAIVADLPYQISRLEWDRMIPLEPMWAQFRRLLKPTGVVVLTASQPFTSLLVSSNPTCFMYALVWNKSRKTGFTHAKLKPLKEHEDILIFSAGPTLGERRPKRQMTYNPQDLLELAEPAISRNSGIGRMTRPDGRLYAKQPFRQVTQTHTNYPTSILRFPSHSPLKGEATHPSQKPVDLMRYLIRTYSNADDVIFDPTMGSASTGVAAIMEGRKFIGIEQNADFFDLAKARIGSIRPRT